MESYSNVKKRWQMRWHTRGSGEGRVDGKMKKQVFDDIRLGSVPSYRMIRIGIEAKHMVINGWHVWNRYASSQPNLYEASLSGRDIIVEALFFAIAGRLSEWPTPIIPQTNL